MNRSLCVFALVCILAAAPATAVVDCLDYRAYPPEVGAVGIPNGADRVTLDGHRLYVTGSRGPHIVDVTHPSSPTYLGAVDTPNLSKVAVAVGDTLFVTDTFSGLYALNVANPVSPQIIGNLDVDGTVIGLEIIGQYAYFTSTSDGLYVADISDPSQPVIVGGSGPRYPVYSLAIAGDYAYLGLFQRFEIFDISDPTDPTFVSQMNLPHTPTFSQVADGVAYLGTSAGLYNIDVSNPASPVQIDFEATPRDIWGMDLVGTDLYLGVYDSGLGLMDVSDPADCVLVGYWETSAAFGVVVEDGLAYIAASAAGVQIIDVSNPPGVEAVIGEHDTAGYAFGAAVNGTVAYVPDHDAGLQILDVSDPSAPASLGSFSVPYANQVVLEGSSLYLATSDGLRILDVSTPASPAQVGALAVSTPVVDVAVTGGLACLVVGDMGLDLGLIVADVSDPAAPFVAGSFDTPGDALGVAAAGLFAYVADGDSGLQIIDLSDPATPTLAGHWTADYGVENVALDGGAAYLTGAGPGLEIVDVSVPSAPALLDEIPDLGYTQDVFVAADLAYVARGYGGMGIVDVSDPADVRQVANATMPGYAEGVVVAADLVVIAGGPDGVRFLRTQCELGIDCDENNIDDAVEIAAHPSLDWNGDGILDICQQGVGDVPGGARALFRLGDAYPNPFNPQTTIAFEMAQSGRVTLAIYDVSGRLVRHLLRNDTVRAGRNEIVWAGRDESGRTAASGLYFYRLEAGGHVETKRMVLIK